MEGLGAVDKAFFVVGDTLPHIPPLLRIRNHIAVPEEVVVGGRKREPVCRQGEEGSAGEEEAADGLELDEEADGGLVLGEADDYQRVASVSLQLEEAVLILVVD